MADWTKELDPDDIESTADKVITAINELYTTLPMFRLDLFKPGNDEVLVAAYEKD